MKKKSIYALISILVISMFAGCGNKNTLSDNGTGTKSDTIITENKTDEDNSEISNEVTHVHNYTENITKEATCTEDGEIAFVCECGDTYTEVIKATGLDSATCEVECYLAQADQYLAVDNPVSAMEVILDAIYVFGKDDRLIAKADDICSHTFVTSKEVYIQYGELGINPVPDQMLLKYEIHKNYDANGAWTSSTIGINYLNEDSERLPEGWMEYSVSSSVPADGDGLCQSSLNRVSYDAFGRINRIIDRCDADISMAYRLSEGGGDFSVSSIGPYQVKEFQYDDLNRVIEYQQYYVDADEKTKVFYKGYKLEKYVYSADGSRIEYSLEGDNSPSGKTFPGSKVHRLNVTTYNNVGEKIDNKLYIYSGEELWITIDECIAKGQLLDHYTYSYPTAYQKEENGMYKFYGETEYRTSHSLDERIGDELEVDEHGDIVPSWSSTEYEGFSYSAERDDAGRLIQSKRDWSYGGDTVTYSYNEAGKITEQTSVTCDGQFTYTAQRKVSYESDGGFVIETYLDGELTMKDTYDRFGNMTQNLDYCFMSFDCLETNYTYNYDGSLMSKKVIPTQDGKSWIRSNGIVYDYFGNVLLEYPGIYESWPATYFYQYTYHYDPNHFIPQGYDIR